MDKQALTPTPDQAAAHELLSEMRTRISTQPLPYQYGVEAKALESLWQVFNQARAAMKNHPGCDDFARITTQMLNMDLRPITAKWHRAYVEGRLNSRDGANEFRSDLVATQKKLRAFAGQLHQMAYGKEEQDALTIEPMGPEDLDHCFAPLPYGIPEGRLIEPATAKAINSAEGKAVSTRRAHYRIPDTGQNAVGLGLSGGGIRSATFCLGVCQVLADRGLLKDVDFLSTVSGGGYLGSFLTTTLNRRDAQASVAAPHGPDPEPVARLRHRAKYMSASNLKKKWMMVATTFAGLLLNWSAPFFVIALMALIASLLSGYMPDWRMLLLASGVLTVVAMLVYAYQIRYRPKPGGGWFLGLSTALTLLVAFLWLLSWVHQRLSSVEWGISGLAAASFAALPVAMRFFPIFRKPALRQLALKVMLTLAGVMIPLGAILVGFSLYDLGTAGPWSLYLLIFFMVTSGLVAKYLLNINLTSPHRLYRDQLAHTFLNGHDQSALELKDINPQGFGPYHLINTTLNLPSSQAETLSDRKSDFFLFSKHWCGAPSIGYHATPDWRAGAGSVDLATAMATSGAAASSHMGLGTIPSLTALMTFLNLRLGYWLHRPKAQSQTTRPKVAAAPGFNCLIREMFGFAMSEKQDWINLSDGGHIENMGVYELLRRRCKFIISVDAEADPDSTFPGHLTLVRHAQIDFGIRIDSTLTDLRPDPTAKVSQSHSMLCRIHYPAAGDQPEGTGLLLYLKSSVTGDEVEMIQRYRGLNPDFPHQTTLDQFFDEEQFEAYRQLGVHVAEGLFSAALLGDQQWPDKTSTWFKGLAQNLLLPDTH